MNGWRERHDLWWLGLLLMVASAAIVGVIGWAILTLIFTVGAGLVR